MRNPSSRNSLTRGCYKSAFLRLCQKTQQPGLSDLDLTLPFSRKGPAPQASLPPCAGTKPPTSSRSRRRLGRAPPARAASWIWGDHGAPQLGALLSRGASTQWHRLGLRCRIPSDSPRGFWRCAIGSAPPGAKIKGVDFEVPAVRGC